MRAFTKFTLLTTLGLGVACGEPVTEIENPPPPVVPVDPPKRDLTPMPGGGTTGGPISNVLTVFVLDPQGEPVPRTLVRAELPFAGRNQLTDEDGRVDFFGKQYGELVALHVLDEAHQFASIYGLNASVLTVQLAPKTTTERALNATTVTGTVSGWSMLPRSTDSYARVGNVFAVGHDIADLEQSPRPGTVTPWNPEGTDSNLLVDGADPFPQWLDYKVVADRRASMLAVLAGGFDLNAEEPTVEFTHLGFTKVEMRDDELNDQNLQISHALDQRLDIVLSETSTLSNHEVHFGIRLNDGTIPLPTVEGQGAAPLLTDDLSNASYHTMVRFWSEDTLGGLPKAEQIAEQRGVETTFTYGPMLEPIEDARNAGLTIAARPATGASMHVFSLTDIEGQKQLWQIIRFGDSAAPIQLPELDKSKVRLAQAQMLTITALDLGEMNLDDTRFDALDQQIRSLSRARAEVWF